ncbi:type II toxin-antitoxin system toxin DNA ADP-ribosyl transferase DarT [Cytobacillus firmus]|uniref:type II toxin-antitoxin system toxin DNA ADP-ribosyl transferase DarT n=1 Tax=Cytobacillus firmus TaxID=1399 RepID=UPI0018CCB079|nr:DUF4433 domain-containing protein [Cytobacillus firmus]MBG9587219.1 hypothetical protein [Cytobacillus firmus]
MDSKFLYHITHYRNLPSILENGELLAYSKISYDKISYNDIAHQNIQSRRSTTTIEVSPYGMLHDYVPFYFAPRSPMLYAINNGKVEGFKGTQDDIIYLVTKTNKILDSGRDFVFTDGHAIMALTEFYNDLTYLDEIDWSVMESKYWNDTDEFPDRKRRRQAEFLVHESVPLEFLIGIGVRNERIKTIVEEFIKDYSVNMKILQKPSFYY